MQSTSRPTSEHWHGPANGERRFKSKVKCSPHLRVCINMVFVFIVFLYYFNGVSFVFHRSVSAFDDSCRGPGNVCFHHSHNEKTKWVHSSSDRLRAMRSCALVRPEGVAAADLQARSLCVRQTVMVDKTQARGVAAAEFFDLGLLQSRHQSFAAVGGGDACFLGMLSLNHAKASALKKNLETNSHTGKTSTHADTRHTTCPTREKHGGAHGRFLYPDLGPQSPGLTFATICPRLFDVQWCLPIEVSFGEAATHGNTLERRVQHANTCIQHKPSNQGGSWRSATGFGFGVVVVVVVKGRRRKERRGWERETFRVILRTPQPGLNWVGCTSLFPVDFSESQRPIQFLNTLCMSLRVFSCLSLSNCLRVVSVTPLACPSLPHDPLA